MNDEIKTEILQQKPTFLEKDGEDYICPSCQQGKMTSANDMFHRWKCDSCQNEGDIVKLYAMTKGQALVGMSEDELYRELKHYFEIGTYCVADILEDFKADRKKPVETSTGFDNLDSVLDGGLREGLYILGAISSLGKTTFCLQIADQIATGGQDVLFFSLEMSKEEIISKSLSRYSYLANPAAALTTLEVKNRHKWSTYSSYKQANIEKAFVKYAAASNNFYIYEGRYKGERLGVKQISEIVNNHVKETGNKPIVFIDYLQILAPADIRATDKQNTDIAVFELKELSRNLKIPVIAISSFNRDNYNEPVSMVSFKESGAVEYSSDVLIGLQYKGMEYQKKENKKWESNDEHKKRVAELIDGIREKNRKGESVEIEIKILKNRNGNKESVSVGMVAKFNCYTEWESDPDGKVHWKVFGQTKLELPDL